jgi:hypothetical protein
MRAKHFLTTVTAAALTAIAAAALLAACNHAGPTPAANPSYPGTEPGTETKLGSITVTVAPAAESSGPSLSIAAASSFEAAASQSAARTVVPEISNSVFDTILVTFTPSSGDPISKQMTQVTETFSLPRGTYHLAVTGLKGSDPIAEGEKSSVVIGETTAQVTVLLIPVLGGADGTFGYNITSLPTVAVAALTLTDPDGNPFDDSQSNPVNSIDLTSSAVGTVPYLIPGEYRLKVFLEKEVGGGEIAYIPPEVVYIYSTLTSIFTWDFSGITLLKTKGPLEMTLSFGPSTIADKNGALSFVQGAGSTFTLTVPNTFDTITWNLDGDVLVDGADGVSGSTYTAPAALQVGTHFMTVTAKSKDNNASYSEIVQFTVTDL